MAKTGSLPSMSRTARCQHVPPWMEVIQRSFNAAQLSRWRADPRAAVPAGWQHRRVIRRPRLVEAGFADLEPSPTGTIDQGYPVGLMRDGDGVLVLASYAAASAVIRLTSNGALDPTFGFAGRAVVSRDLAAISGALTADRHLLIR